MVSEKVGQYRTGQERDDEVVDVNWDAVGAIGAWIGGIATFAAVVVALRESSRAYKPRVSAVVESFARGPFNGILTEGVRIVVTNVGLCRISVKSIVVRNPGREPIEIGIDQGYADCQPFRILDCGEQIERDWPIEYFNMAIPGKRKRRILGFVRRVINRPYRMAVVDTSDREFPVKMPPIVQERIDSAQRWKG